MIWRQKKRPFAISYISIRRQCQQHLRERPQCPTTLKNYCWPESINTNPMKQVMKTTPPLVSTPSEKNCKSKEWASGTAIRASIPLGQLLIMNFSHCFKKKKSVLAHHLFSKCGWLFLILALNPQVKNFNFPSQTAVNSYCYPTSPPNKSGGKGLQFNTSSVCYHLLPHLNKNERRRRQCINRTLMLQLLTMDLFVLNAL